MNEFKLGNLAGLRLTATPLALFGSALLWVVLSALGMSLLHLPAVDAIGGGFVAVWLHWASDLAHQLSHAWVARRTGHPMTGIRFGTLGLLSIGLYPPDEPPLPAAIHIRRALGGPAGSLLLTLAAGVAALLSRLTGGAPWWVGVFFFLDNLIVLTLGAFLPLGFTDGSTLLHWWGKR
jgi:hypothetical protein